ncbi:aconitase/3-isopropylmalate dehydratase large subunit family protein [Halobellus salinisoli]|uniref:aconitase/3-isopropylmalate dehydratase large subunit family protein n=1 Tax=Halobellus salinisoli TaxID=3108500 RepID=UPI00300B4C46
MSTVAEKTLSQKIKGTVTPGDIVEVPIDFTSGHEFSLPPAIDEFERINVDTVFDPDSVAVIPDHLTPSPNQRAITLYNRCKEFAMKHNTLFYPQGTQSQEHVHIPEEGLITPGDVMLAADSHSCTHGAIGVFGSGVGSTDMAYAMAFGELWLQVPDTVRFEFVGDPETWVSGKDLILAAIGRVGISGALNKAVEYGGPVVGDLPMDERFTMANMTIEMGGVTGFVDPDRRTRKYVDRRTDAEYQLHSPDPDADYALTYTIDCDDLEPQVAKPHQVSNVASLSELQDPEVQVDQAVIGSCTNGREADLRTAAKVLSGNTVDADVRLIITPGSQRLERLCIEEGLTETFLEAGATMENPGCGACFGMRTGALGPGEVAVSTTNRNVRGRMGHRSSEVYLASPAVAAASAVTGRLTHPSEVA